MAFSSDNWSGAHPLVIEALTEAAKGSAAPYGLSALDKSVRAKFSELFERNIDVFFVATGTAANALALSSANKPGGHVFCHAESHVAQDECGAPSFFSHGSQMTLIGGAAGKIDPRRLQHEIEGFRPDFDKRGRPVAISITQATEAGTTYSLGEICEIAGIAKRFDLLMHMDGARFANALVSSAATAAEMTWKQGIEMLSFGATKNGCFCAEALILFDTKLSREMEFLQKICAAFVQVPFYCSSIRRLPRR